MRCPPSFAWCCGILAILSPGRVSNASPDSGGAVEGSILDSGIPRELVAQVAPAPGPLAVFDAVERAWSLAQADSLMTVLDPEEKVQLSFAKGGPRGGWFNRDQAYFLLKDMFTFTKTDRFEFQRFWNLDADGRSPYAVAAREFRMNDGATHADQVYVSLRRRGEQWVVGEIRSINP